MLQILDGTAHLGKGEQSRSYGEVNCALLGPYFPWAFGAILGRVLIQRIFPVLLAAALPASASGGAATALNAARLNAAAVADIAAGPVAVDAGTFLPGAVVLPGEPFFRALSGDSAAVNLDAIFNRHWRGVDRFTHNGKTFEVSAAFDLAGETYVSVLAPGAAVPRFYRLERSMNGVWNTAGVNYRADIAITNIFCRICNHIRIQADDGSRVYYRSIKDLIKRAYARGASVRAGGKEFRLYFANDLNRQAEGRVVEDRFGIVLVYGKPDDLKRLIVPFSELSSGQARRYAVQDGPTVVLRIDPATRTLFVSAK